MNKISIHCLRDSSEDKKKIKEIKDSWIRFQEENSKNEPTFLKIKLTDIVMEALNKEFKEQENE